MATSLLSLDRVNAFYGDSHVLHDVSLNLQAGRLLALLGRNGAGKTTCISSIIGFLPSRSGSIRLDGEAIQTWSPEMICRSGVGLVPQGRRVFGSLTVRENLDVAARKGDRVQSHWTRDGIYDIFPRLKERQSQQASSLSGGEQQMLAIGRALMTNPRVLLLDEPSEGLAPQLVREVGQILTMLKTQMSIVLVEQNLGLALKVADDVALLNTGRVVFAGTRDLFEQQQAELQSHLGVE
ncbi:ABC transporter ATP-binding protein [Polaromonas sp. UBA4122]|uniref:ABC transporter ATP-binding protein n=1 Tax=Polaromonas sp. UBA4122 TaxID=1947074 RepID=UPI0025E1B5D6|nr:ABC transporter ATP-binding protein [Polaromonas sp. UBA4122]